MTEYLQKNISILKFPKSFKNTHLPYKNQAKFKMFLEYR